MKTQNGKLNTSDLGLVATVIECELENLQSETAPKGKTRLHRALIASLADMKAKLTGGGCLLSKEECGVVLTVLQNLLQSFTTTYDSTGRRLVSAVTRDGRSEGHPVSEGEKALYLRLHGLCA